MRHETTTIRVKDKVKGGQTARLQPIPPILTYLSLIVRQKVGKCQIVNHNSMGYEEILLEFELFA